MIKSKFILLIITLVFWNAFNFSGNCQKKAVTRQIVLKSANDIKIILPGKLVKVDFKSGDSIYQVKGRISEIRDSAIIVNGLLISVNSIEAIYTNHLTLGNTFLTIGLILIAFDLFETNIITHYGNPVPALFLIPLAVGIPLTVVGVISIFHWKKFDVSQGWNISISNNLNQNSNKKISK